MREWNLKDGQPLSLTLSTDARLEPVDYYNDHIWELNLGGGDPPALALQTTYGLRAKSLRLFPRFFESEIERYDPAEFIDPPAVHQIYPNYLRVTYTPFNELDVESEFWVPQSQLVAGRILLHNQSKLPRKITLDWTAILSPNDGQPMGVEEIDRVTILSGRTEDIAPVVFLTGGATSGAGSFPALRLVIDLEPDEKRCFTWASAALSDTPASYALARSITAQHWEAERSRLEMLNGSLVEIYTENPDWDAAFMLAQKVAYSLFVGPTTSLPFPSYVQTRLPDQGYSLRGDGSDYTPLWNGQTPIECYFLAGLLLPSAPKLAQGLVYNFLAAQSEEGFIDWKPGLGGQRSRLMATPILASLTWRIFETSGDLEFLKDVFPGLLKFLYAWTTPERDRDRDGIPEWDHPMQSGLEDHPVYSYWHEWSQGVDITTTESPALCAFLYQECQRLIQMAEIIERTEVIPGLTSFAEQVRAASENCWHELHTLYHDVDRDSHQSVRGEILAQQRGSGRLIIQRDFEQPVRILVNILCHNSGRPQASIFIHGTSVSGHNRIEKMDEEGFRWLHRQGFRTGERVLTHVEQIDVRGLDPQDSITISTVGHQHWDHTLLLPMWAGIPDSERAAEIIEKSLTNPLHFWRSFGIIACPHPPLEAESTICPDVGMAWQTLIGEGLVRYGYHEQAGELVTRLMDAIVETLKSEGAFRKAYQADSGRGVGERNALNGLAPLGLFMDALGVRIISPNRVHLFGNNPFPWPITLKYRGLTIIRQAKITLIIFPDGQTVNVDDPTPRVVSLE